MLKVHFFETPLGWCAACYSEVGLLLFTLPHNTIKEAMDDVWENFNEFLICGDILPYGKKVKVREPEVEKLYTALRDFFEYGKSFPDLKFDWSITSEFCKNVYKIVKNIPYGEVRTYGWVAKAIGKPKAARAVGQALKRNPFPIIIPCHRVVGVNNIGGFTGKVDLKKKLLTLEGYELKGQGTG